MEFSQKEEEQLIENLKHQIQLLLNLADGILQDTFVRVDDYSSLVSLAFLSRMSHHARVLLTQSGRTSWLLARSMIEGGVWITWMFLDSDPSERGRRCKKWADEVWKELKLRFDQQSKVNTNHEEGLKERIIEGLSANQEFILTEDEKKMLEDNGDLTIKDIFVKRVTGLPNLKSLFGIIEAQQIFGLSYAAMSGFHHWNSLYFGAIKLTDTGRVEWRDNEIVEDTRISLDVAALTLYMALSAAHRATGSNHGKSLTDFPALFKRIHPQEVPHTI
jgi:hypothetical protein